MKKLLSIVVLGLLLSFNTSANITGLYSGKLKYLTFSESGIRKDENTKNKVIKKLIKTNLLKIIINFIIQD